MSKKVILGKKKLIIQEVSNRVKSKKILVISCFVMFIFIITVSINSINKQSNLGIFEVIAKVNGEPITYGEFNHYLQAEISEIYTYFKDKYGVEDNKEFWITAYEGKIPIKMAKERALDSCVRAKVQQIMAKKKEIVKNISYRQTLLNMDEINKNRQQMVKNNQVIYGPITFDEQRYLDNVMINIVRDLKEKVKQDFVFTDKDYSDYYERNKEKYALGSDRKIKAIAVNFANQQEKNRKLREVKEKLSAIKEKLDAGISFDIIYYDLIKNNDKDIKVYEKIYDSNVPRTAGISKVSLIGTIAKLEVGMVTGIIEEDMSIGIYKCEEKKTMSYRTLEYSSSTILLDLIDMKYSELVDQWVKDAQVEIVDKNMKRVKIR